MKLNYSELVNNLQENIMLINWKRYYNKNTIPISKNNLRKYEINNRIPIKHIKNIQPYMVPQNVLLTARAKVIQIPLNISNDFAYFFGYLFGDGSVESNGKRINFSDESFQQMKRMNYLSEKLFNITGAIYSRRPVLSKKPAYTLEIGSKVLNSFFSGYFKFPKGKKHDLIIPTSFFSDRELLKYFLIGLFDSDGTLPKNPYSCKQLFIDIAMKDRGMIEDIKKALSLFGIETLKLYPRKSKSPNSNKKCITWELRIRRRSQIERFLIEIGFSHPDKGNRYKKLKSFLRL